MSLEIMGEERRLLAMNVSVIKDLLSAKKDDPLLDELLESIMSASGSELVIAAENPETKDAFYSILRDKSGLYTRVQGKITSALFGAETAVEDFLSNGGNPYSLDGAMLLEYCNREAVVHAAERASVRAKLDEIITNPYYATVPHVILKINSVLRPGHAEVQI